MRREERECEWSDGDTADRPTRRGRHGLAEQSESEPPSCATGTTTTTTTTTATATTTAIASDSFDYVRNEVPVAPMCSRWTGFPQASQRPRVGWPDFSHLAHFAYRSNVWMAGPPFPPCSSLAEFPGWGGSATAAEAIRGWEADDGGAARGAESEAEPAICGCCHGLCWPVRRRGAPLGSALEPPWCDVDVLIEERIRELEAGRDQAPEAVSVERCTAPDAQRPHEPSTRIAGMGQGVGPAERKQAVILGEAGSDHLFDDVTDINGLQERYEWEP